MKLSTIKKFASSRARQKNKNGSASTKLYGIGGYGLYHALQDNEKSNTGGSSESGSGGGDGGGGE